MGVEPTRKRIAPPTGFEARPPHQGRFSSSCCELLLGRPYDDRIIRPGMGNIKRKQIEEENRPWWGGRASNPVGGAMRSRVGSTPILFRHDSPCVSRPKRARRSLKLPCRRSAQPPINTASTLDLPPFLHPPPPTALPPT